MIASLTEIASVIRSKNAGPFVVTLDVFFDDEDIFQHVVKAEVFSPERIRELYGLDDQWPVEVFFIDAARAVKITMPNRVPSGHLGCTDVYGAQQYFPLLSIEVELDGHEHS